MTKLVRNGQLVTDDWHWIEADAAPCAGRLVLPLALWRARRAALAPENTGVWLGPADELDALLPWLAEIPLIAIHFPLFTDGRGYSQARLLRHRHGYTGELRACGDVLRDQLYFMQRCGFDAFALRADQDPDEALTAFRDYSWVPLAAR